MPVHLTCGFIMLSHRYRSNQFSVLCQLPPEPNPEVCIHYSRYFAAKGSKACLPSYLRITNTIIIFLTCFCAYKIHNSFTLFILCSSKSLCVMLFRFKQKAELFIINLKHSEKSIVCVSFHL